MLSLVILFAYLGSVSGAFEGLDPEYTVREPLDQFVLYSPTEPTNPARDINIAMIPHATGFTPAPATIAESVSNDKSPDLSQAEASVAGPWLIVSPYVERDHQLNLSSLDQANQLLARALTRLEAATPTYATETYDDALNWPVVFADLKSLSAADNFLWTTTTFYVVEFRSKLKLDIDRPKLFRLDKESHREATASGGLLKYWFGSPDAERRNLATCLWRNKEDAVAGGKGPEHKKARGIIPQMYESIDVTGLKLTVYDDVEGWQFEPWSDW